MKDNCPLDNFNPCRQFDCAWFMKVQGNNPNTGEPTEECLGASMAWLPILDDRERPAEILHAAGAFKLAECTTNEMMSANQENPNIAN